MEKQLLSLTVVACCAVALSACSQTAAPPTRPQASAESVVDIAAPADSGSDSGVTFAMPEPGPFVPGPDVDIFKPCEEIPDEVFAELGLRKDPEGGDSFAPYSCRLFEQKESQYGRSIDMATWDVPISDLISNEIFVKLGEFENPTGITVKENTLNTDGYCEALVETKRGTVSVGVMDMFNPSTIESICKEPQRIAIKIFGGN